MLFLSLTALTGLVAIGAMLLAYGKEHDSFHPLAYLGPMLFSLYCLLPLYLYQEQGLFEFLTMEELEYVQFLNLLGVMSLCSGVLWGGGRIKRVMQSSKLGELPAIVRQRINFAAKCLGILGVTGYVFQIKNVGGLEQAYGQAYGGGWDDIGYIRESVLLTVPGILLLMSTHVGRQFSKLEWAWILLFASPLIIQGLLGARRGPTFMVIVALIVGWYLMRSRRPPLWKLVTGGSILGLFLLFLVSNRGAIYLGSEFEFEHAPTDYLQAGTGNEYIYGAGAILNADASKEYWWGRRYLTVFFIRPIPRFLWSSKYEDASHILGIPNLEENMGTGGDIYLYTIGWIGAVGAAPGIIADMWIEFSWLSFFVLFLVGLAYGRVWNNAVSRGGPWIPIYALMVTLSIYLVMQTLEAMAFRFLLTAVPTWLVWRNATHGIAKRNHGNCPPSPIAKVRVERTFAK